METSRSSTSSSSWQQKHLSEILQVRKNILECFKIIGYTTNEYENISSAEILSLPDISALTMDIYKSSSTSSPSPSSSSSTSHVSSPIMTSSSELTQEMSLTSELDIALSPPVSERPKMVRVVYIEDKISKDELINQIETHFQSSLVTFPDSTGGQRNFVNDERKLSMKDTLMLISFSEKPISDVIREYLRRYWETKNIFVTVQCYKYFMFCILKHQFVPPHIILTKEEKENIMTRFRVREEEELSEISRFDPVAIAILLRPGEMVEIHRPSVTAGVSLHYRVCVQK